MPELSENEQKVSNAIVAYSTSWEHLSDELRRLDLLIYLQVLDQRNRQSLTNPLERFKGLVITEEEINCLLGEDMNLLSDKNLSNHDNPKNQPLMNALYLLESQIQLRRAASIKEGIYLSLPHLSQLFHLTPFEEQCLLICLAPELDRKYEKLYAYLQDDVTRKKPSVDMVLNLLCQTMQEKLTARLAFDPQATLLKYRLIQIIDNAPDGPIPLLSRFLKLDDRIVNFLINFGQVDARLASLGEIISSQKKWNQVMVTEGIRNRMQSFVSSYFTQKKSLRQKIIFYFYGPYGTEKRSLAEATCHDLGLSLIIGDVRKMLDGPLAFGEAIGLLCREAILQKAALCLEHFDYLLSDDDKHYVHLKALLKEIQSFSGLTLFLLGNRPWYPQGFLNEHIFITIEFQIPDDKDRKRFWESCFGGRYQLANDVDLGALAGKFRFTPGQIQDAIITARNYAYWSSPEGTQITMEYLYTACRAQSNQKLSTLAHKIKPKYTWDEIVLPDDALAQMREMCQRVAYRHRVLGDWGFDRKLSQGKGVNALFLGPSGTGKTMAVEIIANELGLDLYKVDLSGVVSKYIGETEKNLDRIFTATTNANAILFFDEADALFGKRSEVRDSHDRYANIEISYLLQKMEEYEGVSILASNLGQNLDEAFIRRLAFTIHFPFPDDTNRRHIWEKIWPEETPLGDGVDLDFLARQFKMSGGNIKNIALSAAFLAANDGGTITMTHLLHATRREYQKMGKFLSESELKGFRKDPQPIAGGAE